MKRVSWLTVGLVSLIIVNMFLIFYLFNSQARYEFAQQLRQNRKSNPVVQREVEDPYYHLVDLDLMDLLGPTSVIVRDQGKLYRVPKPSIWQDILDQEDSTPLLSLVDNTPIIDPVGLAHILDQDHVQLLFFTKFSIPLLSDLVEVPKDQSTQFAVNRIVFAKDDQGSVYLVDSEKKSYLQARLTDAKRMEAILGQMDATHIDQIEVVEYPINRDSVYLPKSALLSPSQVFTLEKNPENLLVHPIFGSENFDITQPDVKNERILQNYNTSLRINDTTRMMTLTKSRNQGTSSLNQDGNLMTQKEKVTKALDFLKKFTYWDKGVFYAGENNNQFVFRRALEGIPIFSAPEIEDADYGVTRMTLGEQASRLELGRLQMPLLMLGVHVPDQSKQVKLESADEISQILEDEGLKFSQFNQILIGMEWQKEMENLKKVILVPKWYFQVGNQFYSIDQVRDGTVRAALKEVSGGSSDLTAM